LCECDWAPVAFFRKVAVIIDNAILSCLRLIVIRTVNCRTLLAVVRSDRGVIVQLFSTVYPLPSFPFRPTQRTKRWHKDNEHCLSKDCGPLVWQTAHGALSMIPLRTGSRLLVYAPIDWFNHSISLPLSFSNKFLQISAAFLLFIYFFFPSLSFAFFSSLTSRTKQFIGSMIRFLRAPRWVDSFGHGPGRVFPPASPISSPTVTGRQWHVVSLVICVRVRLSTSTLWTSNVAAAASRVGLTKARQN